MKNVWITREGRFYAVLNMYGRIVKKGFRTELEARAWVAANPRLRLVAGEGSKR